MMSNERLYGLDTGFKSYFLGINSRGHLTLRINRSEIDLYEVITRHGLSSGYIRIYPTIRYVMSVIHKAFREALVKHGYRGKVYYTYPLKTNSIDRVLDKINNYGKEYSWGFNTGTLEELLIAKKYIDNPRILVVDGVKNREIIKLAREFAEKGWRVYIDIESRREAELLRDTGLNLGLRIKLLTPSTGAWHNATGLDSKFGLNISQVIELLENYPWLRRQIKLLHVHPGSQIDDIEVLVKVFHEAANLYRELRETYELESLEAIDLGGGLAYPYDPLKPNYTIKEYVDKLVEALKNACIRENCPSIIFENGRIIVAFHRIVFSKILDVRPYTIHCRGNIGFPIIDKIRSATTLQELGMITREAVEILTRLRRGSTYESLEQRRMLEELDACIKSLISTKLYEIVSMGNNLGEVLTDLTRYPNYL